MAGKSAAVLKVAEPVPEDPLAAYPAKYLECRVDRHQWGKAVWELISGNVSERIRQCKGCGMKRVEVINTRTWTPHGRSGQVPRRARLRDARARV
jgi:hypothetical protein